MLHAFLSNCPLYALLFLADIAGHPRTTWQSLVGAALGSYYKSLANQNSRSDDSIISRFLDLSRKHKTCYQVLSPVADILDSVCGYVGIFFENQVLVTLLAPPPFSW